MIVIIGFRRHEDDPTSLLSLRLDGETRRDTRSQIHEHVNKSSIKIHLLASFTKLYLRFVVFFFFFYRFFKSSRSQSASMKIMGMFVLFCMVWQASADCQEECMGESAIRYIPVWSAQVCPHQVYVASLVKSISDDIGLNHLLASLHSLPPRA